MAKKKTSKGVKGTSGIYALMCTKSNQVYIGRSSRLSQRKSKHFRDLRLNAHHCTALQREYNLYGEGAFEWIVLEYAPKEKLEQKEMEWMIRHRTRLLNQWPPLIEPQEKDFKPGKGGNIVRRILLGTYRKLIP